MNLAEAVEAVGEAPCDTCPHRQRCYDEYLACTVFAHWTENSRRSRKATQEPSREVYRRVFGVIA